MPSLYLTSYISSPVFLEELKKRNLPYDGVFSDICYENSPFPSYTPANKPANQSLLAYRTEMLAQTKHPLFILNQLPLSFLSPLRKHCKDTSLTIINLFTGMGSLGRKLNAELSDMELLPRDFPKYEPLDVMNFFQILQQPHTKYLRIPYQHFPESIFSTADIGIIDAQMLGTLETLSLKHYGYSGEHGTIIATGANFPTLLQLGDLLQAQKQAMDLFIVIKMPFPLTTEIRHSLHQKKKLIRISDFLPSNVWKDAFASSLVAQGLKNVETLYLSPQYERLTTIFDEFSAQQAGFDAKGLAERII